MNLKITKKRLVEIISEEITVMRESSADYTELNRFSLVNAIKKLRSRITNIEDAIDMMGGSIISYRQDIQDLEKANQERIIDRSRDLASVEEEN